MLKQLYDTTKSAETKTDDSALPELIVKDFDEEQIWQELELQNSARFKLLANTIQKFTKNDLVLVNKSDGKLVELPVTCFYVYVCQRHELLTFIFHDLFDGV